MRLSDLKRREETKYNIHECLIVEDDYAMKALGRLTNYRKH